MTGPNRKPMPTLSNVSGVMGHADREWAERLHHLIEYGATGKAFLILECVAAQSRPVAISEILRATGLTKPSAHRIVNMLCEMGFLERDPTGFGVITGYKMVELGERAMTASAQRGIRRALLEELSSHVGETCNYGILSGAQVTYLERVEAKWPLGLRFDAGSKVPAHCTAIGKLLLSKLPADELLSIINSVSLNRYTSRTLTNPVQLQKALMEIRQSQIGVDDQEFMDGVVCIAVPVTMSSGRNLGAIAISAPEARMTLEKALRYVPIMRDIASRFAETYAPDKNDRRKRL